MKLQLKSLLILLALGSTSYAQSSLEVAFSLQNSQFTWFEVGNPGNQGNLAASGLPSGFEGNALGYDSTGNRLLFTDGKSGGNRNLYSLALNGITLSSGGSVDAGSVQSLGVLTFASGSEIFGGTFYNGSYYALINGTDTLRKVDFSPTDGSILSQTNINLPGSNTMYLGDIAFDANNTLWISGNNDSGNPTASNDRLWRYSYDGSGFTALPQLSPSGSRFNGIFFDEAGTDLYGYRLSAQTLYSIDTTSGDGTATFTGDPFGGGGDLTNGFRINVVPEPSSALLVLMSSSVLCLQRRRKIAAP